MSKPSDHYAILGNQADTPFPIVDPTTGAEMAILDKAWLTNFATEHPEQYQKMMQVLVPQLRAYTGGKLRELESLHELSPHLMAKMVKSIRERIVADLEHWPFLEKFSPEYRAEALREYASQADELIHQVIHEWMPQLADEISLSNEVKSTNDPAELLAMAFNRGLNPRTRFEAKRKFLFMKMLGEMFHYDEKRKHHEEAMSRMSQWLADEMYAEPTAGGRSGDQQQHYLVSKHDTVSNERRTLKAAVNSEAPRILEFDQRSTSLGMRRVGIKTMSGTKREIDCMIDVRDRRTFARMIKKMHRDEPVEALDHDYNGLRLVFKRGEDLNDFIQTLKEKIHNNIASKLVKRLTDAKGDMTRSAPVLQRLTAMDDAVQVKIESDNLSNADPAKLKMMVIRLTVRDEDDKTYTYELQTFLPDGYADYKYREDMTREEHQADRFFDGPSELMFPTTIFPKLNHHTLHQAACKAAHENAWNKGADGFVVR